MQLWTVTGDRLHWKEVRSVTVDVTTVDQIECQYCKCNDARGYAQKVLDRTMWVWMASSFLVFLH